MTTQETETLLNLLQRLEASTEANDIKRLSRGLFTLLARQYHLHRETNIT